MKINSSKTLAGLNAAAIGFRWLFVIAFFATLVKVVLGPTSLKATVSLDGVPAQLAVAHVAAAPVHVSGIKADIELPVAQSGDSDLVHIARLTTGPTLLLACIAGIVLCSLSQALIVNLSAGQLFSTANIRLLKTFTAVLIASTVLVRIAIGWSNQAFGSWAAAHLTVGGSHLQRFAENVTIGELGLNLGNADIIVVLLLLLLVWAFKEGASLKQEHDLTV